MCWLRGGFFALKVYALTLPPIGFALRSVQTHISKQFRIDMCVYTLLKANLMGGRVRAYALKDKINFTVLAGAYGPLQGQNKRWVRNRLRLASHIYAIFLCVLRLTQYMASVYNYIYILNLFHYPINSTYAR